MAARSDPLLFDLLIAILSGLVTILLVRAVAAVLRIGRARRRHLAGVALSPERTALAAFMCLHGAAGNFLRPGEDVGR